MSAPVQQPDPAQVDELTQEQSEPVPPSDTAYWAKRGSVLSVGAAPEDALNINVTGRRVTGPIQGFGQMWDKTFSVRLSGAQVTPQEVIATWKAHFPEFWPAKNRFYGPLTGIAPGEVALLNLSMAPIVRLSTGVMVLYADDESFTLMTPEGHVFAGWITFSAHEDTGVTVAQAKMLIRASDPAYEIGLMLGGHARENRFWEHTLRALAAYFGVQGHVESRITCIDTTRQWSNAGNIRHNAFIRSALYDAVLLPRRAYRSGRRKLAR
jgi:hypothetical protein